MFDAVSVDEYAGTLNKSGQPRTKSTCPHPTLEAKCVFDFMRASVYPRLKPHQRVFVVPGTYGLTASDGGETDRMLKAKLELYWELAVKDPLVIGIKPWHFANEHAVPANATDAVWINQVILPTAPGVSNQGRSSPLLVPFLTGCFLALGSGLRLVGTVSSRR